MEKIVKKIIFLDFDDTLIINPDPADALNLWEEKFGVKHHNNGWWNTPESLNTEIFTFKVIESVVEYVEKIKDPNTLTVLLTNRPNTIEKEVINLLEYHNIYLDIHTFKTKPFEKKSDRVATILEKYLDVNEVYFFDDLFGHLLDISELDNSPKYSHINFNLIQVADNYILTEF